MRAVHFGAGNIGRGFIGKLLCQSGYKTCFLDVNDELVKLINEQGEYTVQFADESQKKIVVNNVQAINSARQAEEAITAISEANIITAAVGPAVLPHIAGTIAEGLRRRSTPVNIIACENMVGGSTLLKEKVMAKIPPEERAAVEARTGFPDAAVDRIVPNQFHENKLTVTVEPFYEWAVEETKIAGDKPGIAGITWVKDLTPYIERKLFTVNTGHAVAAYFGWLAGAKTIDEALKIDVIKQALQATLQETGRFLVKKYGFDPLQHDQYIAKIISRFSNPYITDDITRVGRAPIRKIGRKDRLVSPAVQYKELLGETPIYLAKSIAAVLLYDYAKDSEAVELQGEIQHNGVEAALKKFAQLNESDPLLKEIVKQYEELAEKGVQAV